MPELPDVEVFKRYFNRTALRKKIQQVDARDSYLLKGVSAARLRKTLEGRSFQSTRRHGKYLFVNLDNQSWLVFHFGMTGSFKYFKNRDEEPDHTRLLITFANSYHLAFDCRRRLGRIMLTEDPDEFLEKKRIGPDALDLKYDDFKEALQRGGMLKTSLMNQRIVAGIGNIYADEILLQSGLHPKTKVNQLDEKDLKRVFQKTREVLQNAIKAQVDPARLPKSYMLRERKEGAKCPRCTSRLKREVISGRSAYYCPSCQTL